VIEGIEAERGAFAGEGDSLVMSFHDMLLNDDSIPQERILTVPKSEGQSEGNLSV
jgi:hypothetical protein